jgi:hypothetical protein
MTLYLDKHSAIVKLPADSEFGQLESVRRLRKSSLREISQLRVIEIVSITGIVSQFWFQLY